MTIMSFDVIVFSFSSPPDPQIQSQGLCRDKR